MAEPTLEPRDKIEVWKNQAAGMRWYKILDRQGHEIGKTVHGYRTFTLTPFDRQINQDKAASPEQDLFRNGNFVLIKKAVDTHMDEIESPDSFTDAELTTLVHEVLAKDKTIDAAIHFVESSVTLGRLLDELVIEDAPKSYIDVVKAKKDSKEDTIAAEREFVSEGGPPEEEVKTPTDIPEVETAPMVVTQPEKV